MLKVLAPLAACAAAGSATPDLKSLNNGGHNRNHNKHYHDQNHACHLKERASEVLQTKPWKNLVTQPDNPVYEGLACPYGSRRSALGLKRGAPADLTSSSSMKMLTLHCGTCGTHGCTIGLWRVVCLYSSRHFKFVRAPLSCRVDFGTLAPLNRCRDG